MKIVLDAGHGYATPGKRSPDGMREYEFNRAVAEYTRKLLVSYEDVTVTFAHSDERDIPLAERTRKANLQRADLYVSIHANAFSSGWSEPGGIETYVYLRKPPVAYALAQKIQRNAVATTGLRNRGVKTADFHVLRETMMDAVLIEAGFMTNREESQLLLSETYRRIIAKAIASATAEQYRLKKKNARKY
ncbi:N-acetylmuramoyl-L-alanine amidase [Bacillus massilinigeriensis]|uniref:N-acetylmuramoyl-L-alanine amidase n=1 Tax=Bacillus mediterraneensis TaxID=1805474 RepID=UPI0008F8DFFA|nr:N-acetylmuramoyl-L-alanine amidase [Bacillus mediterraneensis]